MLFNVDISKHNSILKKKQKVKKVQINADLQQLLLC